MDILFGLWMTILALLWLYSEHKLGLSSFKSISTSLLLALSILWPLRCFSSEDYLSHEFHTWLVRAPFRSSHVLKYITIGEALVDSRDYMLSPSAPIPLNSRSRLF